MGSSPTSTPAVSGDDSALVRRSDESDAKAASAIHKAREQLVLSAPEASTASAGMTMVPLSLASMTKVDRLRTYLPTGTWATYTTLQTLAFSLSPGVPPPEPRNCNTSQEIALIVFIALSAAFSFVQPLVKTFVLDPSGEHIVYPAPSGVEAADTIHDDVTRVTFPYRDAESQRLVWPVLGLDGRCVHEGGYLKVIVFEKGCTFVVRSQRWTSRLLARVRPPVNTIALLPRMDSDDPELKTAPPPVTGTIDGELQKRLPELRPRWSGITNGSKTQYVDLSLQAFLHALVSVSAFLSLALLSTQVTGCLYPRRADWIGPVVQIATLAAISAMACLFVDDRAAGPQLPEAPAAPSAESDSEKAAGSVHSQTNAEVAPLLSHLVADVIWVHAVQATAV